MTRQRKKERERLERNMNWCKEIALDHYMNGRIAKGQEWEREVIRLHHQIMMLHPWYKRKTALLERRQERKERRTIKSLARTF